MDKYMIEGGRELYGEVEVQSAKNAVLPLFAASLLAGSPVTIGNIPLISDVSCMAEILRELGAKVTFRGKEVVIDPTNAHSHALSSRLTKELRSSVFMLGSLLSRFHRAIIAYPGGCDIGLRPIDLHLGALKRLGVKIAEEDGYILCSCEKLKGEEILLDFPSVGATENILLAAVEAEGRTILRNAAREPEIVDLARFLNGMGAKVRGAGSDTVVIDGVKELHGIEFTPCKDRIEAGTFLIAGAICGGEIAVNGINGEFLNSLLHKLRENGCKIGVKNDKITIENHRRIRCNRRIETLPYPGFPTDLQAQIAVLNCFGVGSCMVVENLFETRFRYVQQLVKMGADIRVKERTAFIVGVEKLHGASLVAEDLRGGAALVLAALGAEGSSEVLDLSFLDRGYSDFHNKLKQIGANVQRVSV